MSREHYAFVGPIVVVVLLNACIVMDAGDNGAGVGVRAESLATTGQVVSAEADAYVSSSQPGTNYGSAQLLCADTNTQQKWMYFRFPAAASVSLPSRVTMRFYVDDNASTEPFDVRVLNNQTWVEAGEPSGIDWANKPGSSQEGAVVGTLWPSDDFAWYEVDVTQYYVPGQKLSVVVKSAGAAGNAFCVRAREYAGYEPQLVLDYYAMKPSGDTYVSSAMPTANFGQDNLWAESDQTVGQKQSLLKFQFGPVLGRRVAEAAVRRVMLRLYVRNASADEAGSALVSGVGNSWTEGGATWNNTRSLIGGAQSIGLISVTTVDRWVDLDITRYVNDHVTETSTALSLALTGVSADAFGAYSREDTNGPHLLVLLADPDKSVLGDGSCTTGETCCGLGECAPGAGRLVDCGECPAGAYSGGYIPVWGDLHAHAIGDPLNSSNTCQADAGSADACTRALFDYARFHRNDGAGSDFLVLSEHVNLGYGGGPNTNLTAGVWDAVRDAANDKNDDDVFVASTGLECALFDPSGNRRGHANVPFADGVADPFTIWPPAAMDRETLYAALAGESMLGLLNHPLSGEWGWPDTAPLVPSAVDRFTLRSLSGGVDESYGTDTWGTRLSFYYDALQTGWRFAPTWDSDAHMNGGPYDLPEGMGESGRTGFFASKLRRAELLEAAFERRSFATEANPSALITLRVNGYWMGSQLTASGGTIVTVSLDASIRKGNEVVELLVLLASDSEYLVLPCHLEGLVTSCSANVDWALPATIPEHYYLTAHLWGSTFAVSAPVWIEPPLP